MEAASQDTAAQAVAEDLSAGVRVAIGAAGQRRPGLDAGADPAGVEPSARGLFADALRVAYRVLFAAFAEDRGLLPVAVPAYDSAYSLASLRRLVSDPANVWSPDDGYLWAALRSQWRLLRDGVRAGEMRVGAFNGELFDISGARCSTGTIWWWATGTWPPPSTPSPSPSRSPCGVLPLLVGASTTASPGVEQLGSIYEGLLAFEARITVDETVLATAGKGAKRVTQLVPQPTWIRTPTPKSWKRCRRGRSCSSRRLGRRKGSVSTPPACPGPFRGARGPAAARRRCVQRGDSLLAGLRPGHGFGRLPRPRRPLPHRGLRGSTHPGGCRPRPSAGRRGTGHLSPARCRALHLRGRPQPDGGRAGQGFLWLATAAAGKPLSFLDANLRCGDALVGADLQSWSQIRTGALPGGATQAS